MSGLSVQGSPALVPPSPLSLNKWGGGFGEKQHISTLKSQIPVPFKKAVEDFLICGAIVYLTAPAIPHIFLFLNDQIKPATQICALKFRQKDPSFEGLIKKDELKRFFGTNAEARSFTHPEPPSYTEANCSHLNVSNSFSKPGLNFPLQFSMKAQKHLQMEKHHTYNFGVCILCKSLCLFLLSFLFKRQHRSWGSC